MSLTIAIDGPAGAGKSTVSRKLAQKLGYSLVDTGAMYRTVAWLAQEKGVSLDAEAALAALGEDLPISFQLQDSENKVFLAGQDISAHIRTPELSRAASAVAKLPMVRAALLDLQRRLAQQGSAILEGRDIGTVVCPEAPLKFFLTASVEARAQRRYAELQAAGHEVSIEETRREVEARDFADSTRAIAPLRQASDAILVDASERSADEVVAEMARIAQERVQRVTKKS